MAKNKIGEIIFFRAQHSRCNAEEREHGKNVTEPK